MENNHCVYMHIFPDGKRYIGATRSTPETRWKNGHGYSSQPVYKEIKKYKWDEITHIVLIENIDGGEACFVERSLIEFYSIFDSDNLLNVDCNNVKATRYNENAYRFRGEDYSLLEDVFVEEYVHVQQYGMHLLSNAWLLKYGQDNKYPYRFDLGWGYIDLYYIDTENNVLIDEAFRVHYPENVTNCLELWDFLYKGRKEYFLDSNLNMVYNGEK